MPANEITAEMNTYLAAALAKQGQPVDLTEADLDAGLNIKLTTTPTGIRVHVTWWDGDDE